MLSSSCAKKETEPAFGHAVSALENLVGICVVSEPN